MRSTPELLGAAQATMMKWPALWLPPFLISALQLMASGPYQSPAAQVLVFTTTNLGVFIIEAGWLALIHQALQDKPVRMDEFKAGINRHWLSLVVGNLAFYVVLALLLGALAAAGNALYGWANLDQWYRSLASLPPEKLDEMLRPEHLSAPIRGWMSLFAAWMGLAAVSGFLLLYWQPVTVLRGVSWWRGWLGSIKLVLGRFGQTVAFAALHMIMLGTSLAILAGGSALGALVGLGLLLALTIFFKILYASVVWDAWPPAVDATA